MHLILLGAPGTGKGTQAKVLAERFKWLHVSTGDLLRAAVANGTDLGKTAKGYMDQGALVPDELVIRMLVDRIGGADAGPGFILDGFPRNLAQARALDAALTPEGKRIDLALSITVPDEELVRRLTGRWMCRSCGSIFQEASSPPKVAGRCDNCGGELYQREDDKSETVRARLAAQKPPEDLLAYYRDDGKLMDIDGLQTVDKVTGDLVDSINAQRGQPA